MSMASEPQIGERDESQISRIPPPVEGGTEFLGSLGRFIDDLFGDSRRRRRVNRELAPLLLRSDELPEDPAPSDPPPPVPDGNEDVTRGAKPGSQRQ